MLKLEKEDAENVVKKLKHELNMIISERDDTIRRESKMMSDDERKRAEEM